MKQLLLIYASLMISASVMFGQELPQLKVTERDMTGRIFRCAGDNETVVEIQSNVPLTFSSNMDKAHSQCDGSPREESGFFWYELLFQTNTEYKKYDGRKLTIQSRGFEYYILPLDLKAKTPVGFLVINETKRKADDFYSAGNYSEALKEYEKLRAINPKDDFIAERIVNCNARISVSVTGDNGKTTSSGASSLIVPNDNSRTLSAPQIPTSSYKGCDIEIMAYDLYKEEKGWGDVNCPKGWRLPTREELKCMCKAQKSIGNFEPHQYFTSEFNRYGQKYFLSFEKCKEGVREIGTHTARVRCVKDKNELGEEYIVEQKENAVVEKEKEKNNKGDSTAFFCGLEVMLFDLPGEYTWSAALRACPNGWRLPTSEELKCLCKNKKQIGGFNEAFFNEGYWSSDSHKKRGYAIIHTFDDCAVEFKKMDLTGFCRCVRDINQ